MSPKKANFARILLKWHKYKNDRKMPWKGEKNPYRIWLSEVILQQTRVDQGWAYYEKFLQAFPTVHDLAGAPEKKVFKLWEGLGYYNRCRNLITTAKKIDAEYNGEFPNTYETILSLKGIGPYTAAAIASFAFRLPHAVVDGNVTRILSRYFGEFTPIDSSKGKKIFAELADSLLDREQPDLYNQAIMDFGATVCLPRNPLCNECTQNTGCQAWQKGWTSELPVKEKSTRKKQRWLYYFIVETPDDKVYIRQRTTKDIWAGLFEFVLHEASQPIYFNENAGPTADLTRQLFGRQPVTTKHISRIYRQELTHQTIQGQFITVRTKKELTVLQNYQLIDRRQLPDYAFPKFINAWREDPTTAQSLLF
jgi:A/G-specific adenine glycosylase